MRVVVAVLVAVVGCSFGLRSWVAVAVLVAVVVAVAVVFAIAVLVAVA